MSFGKKLAAAVLGVVALVPVSAAVGGEAVHAVAPVSKAEVVGVATAGVVGVGQNQAVSTRDGGVVHAGVVKVLVTVVV